MQTFVFFGHFGQLGVDQFGEILKTMGKEHTTGVKLSKRVLNGHLWGF